MALSGITVNVSTSGIGRRAPSTDKISGILWFNATWPSGMSTTARYKKVFSLAEAEALGITEALTSFNALWYHIREYFRIQPEGELWIGIVPVPAGTYDFTEITAMLAAANGEIKQLGVYANLLNFASAQVTTIQGVLDTNAALGYRCSVLYAPNFQSAYDWTTTTDLRTLTAPRVSVVTGQDGSGKGAALFTAKSFTISCLGAELGAVSKASVQQSIGNPANFNISNGTELEVPAMANGTLQSTMSNTLLGAIKDKGYSIIRKYTPRISGTYFERVPTATSATSDLAWLEFQRTIDKAVRGLESKLTPAIQSSLYIKADGTLNSDTIGYFTDLCGKVLLDMIADGELSGSPSDISKMVLIDPNQNVQSTSQLKITVKLLPVGVAEFIVLNIGFTTSL